MDCHDIFLSRLKLLVMMARAYLEDYPLGEYRKRAIVSTAREMIRETVDWGGDHSNFRSSSRLSELMGLDHLFYQRVKLLSLMTRTFAEDYPIGYHRRRAIQDNLEEICATVSFTSRASDMVLLEIA